MLNKIRNLLNQDNYYFFGIKNGITALLIVFFLIDCAFLGLNHSLAQVSKSQEEEEVAGVTAEQDVEIVVKDEEESGEIFNFEPPSDFDQPDSADDESGKILQEAAFISREELDDADISADNTDSADKDENGGNADESSGSDAGDSNGTDVDSATADSNYTAEEQAVVDQAEEVCYAVAEADGERFYNLLSADLQDIFGKQAVLDAFATQYVNVSSTEVISDPEMVGDGYAQLKVRFTFADRTTEAYWVYLVKENGKWRLMGTKAVD